MTSQTMSDKDRRTQGLADTARTAVKVLFIAITVPLLTASLFFTSRVSGGYDEKAEFLRESPAAIVVFLTACAMFRIKTGERGRCSIRRIPAWGFIAYAAACFVYALTQAYWPASDAGRVMECAVELFRGQSSPFSSLWYLEQYPGQAGLVLFELPAAVFGQEGIIRYMTVVNAISAFSAAMLLSSAETEGLRAETFITSVMFFPALLFISFVYGTLAYTAAAIAGCSTMIDWAEDKDAETGITAVLYFLCAVIVKQNALIMLIAGTAGTAFVLIKQAEYRRLWFPFLLFMSVTVLSGIPKAVIMKVSGIDMNNGIPAVSWVAMGMQDGERAPGWYNGFNEDLYEASGGSRELQVQTAMNAISGRLSDFKEDPRTAAGFYLKKAGFMWLDPSCSSIWNIEVMNMPERKMSRGGLFRNEQFKNILFRLMKFMHVYILAGGVLCAFLVKVHSPKELCFMLTFIGGFLFHVFLWEAKSQYTLPYYMCLIPLAAHGWNTAGDKLLEKRQK